MSTCPMNSPSPPAHKWQHTEVAGIDICSDCLKLRIRVRNYDAEHNIMAVARAGVRSPVYDWIEFPGSTP
jgi:hypothetical protein